MNWHWLQNMKAIFMSVRDACKLCTRSMVPLIYVDAIPLTDLTCNKLLIKIKPTRNGDQ